MAREPVKPESLDDALALFRAAVEPAFADVQATAAKLNMADLLEDWLQANWEILVESQVRTQLVVYGEGAESETSRFDGPRQDTVSAYC